MAQPTPYNRVYNFTDYQSANPDDPLPGVQVDAELNNVRVTLSQTLSNLALIQRDDGRLSNQSVGKDTLDASALALIGLNGFNPRGDWAALTAYAVGDLVDFNDATYVALEAHTSDIAFATDLGDNRWLLIANAALINNPSAIDLFIGDATETEFGLTYNYTDSSSAQVFVNGILNRPTTDYTISGTTITFVSAPPAPVVPGEPNVVVWGSTVAVQAAKQAAEAAAANALSYSSDADASKIAAAASASAAAASASAASGSATSASTSATNAASSASAASTSATNAASSATSASGSASTATTQATNASNSASAAATSATNSAASATLANDWATKTASPVAGGEYSAKYHALAASSSATSAASSASAASTSASAASTSATNAATSATNAANSASSASTSATNAANSASAASTSATNAAASESSVAADAAAAAASETAAAASAATASTAASNAATSEANAASSETNAAASASAAATSASNALTSADNAAASEVAAAASAASAASALDAFDDRYLGSKTTAPTLDNDGNALVGGALYYNDGTVVVDDKGMWVYDGGTWIKASAASQAALVTYEYVATASQTVFSGTDANGLTLTYIAGGLLVSINGVVLRPGDDYTATNGSSITLTSAAAAGDELCVYAFASFTLANVYTKEASDLRFAQVANNLSDLASASAARTNLGLVIGTDVQAYDATILKSADIGTSVQAYDATILKSADIGTSVQGYDADLATLASSGFGVSANQIPRMDSSARLPIGANWTVAESGGVLYFAHGGTNKFKIDSSGNLTVTGNVTAYGTV